MGWWGQAGGVALGLVGVVQTITLNTPATIRRETSRWQRPVQHLLPPVPVIVRVVGEQRLVGVQYTTRCPWRPSRKGTRRRTVQGRLIILLCYVILLVIMLAVKEEQF